MARKRHPRKMIEQAVRYAESRGWTVKAAGNSAHAWGILQCPANSRECRCGRFCRNGIWSTPRNEQAHARHIRRCVDHCLFEPSVHLSRQSEPDSGSNAAKDDTP